MSRINKTQYAILGALSVYPMSGYDIKKWILNVTGPFWAESPGQIHPTLKNLLKNNMITCENSQDASNRPKKIYTITKKGLTTLKSWLLEDAASTIFRDEFILKLFYGKHISKKNYIAHVKSQKKKMQEDLKQYQIIAKHIGESHKKADKKYWLITLSNAICHAKAEIKWCNQLIKQK
jgi:PadR family transcriptional regulator, regulatory protein AphA